ncbi:unnamed protein product [Miscanthus lutarioriparius]|uniref:Uncharacterized protein n=1 Tax=Miscanthus lutarioriparius TaxID=422564 RepID=A0A811NYU6_9POAL|nr:unnamed protein product [Miscanthus lutarioriparius]
MRTITARSPHDSSFSFSRRNFKWPVLVKSSSHGAAAGGGEDGSGKGSEADDEDESAMAFSSTCPSFRSEDFVSPPPKAPPPPKQRSKKCRTAVSRLRTALAAAIAGRHRQVGLGARLTGTLYGHRRGHVHLAFQVDPRACPALLLELAAPTASLVREMASGLVRIALECDRAKGAASAAAATNGGGGGGGGGCRKLVEEKAWRAYCNGKGCGYAVRRECGAADWRVLRALEPVSMGAGVIPAACGGGEGDVMYMRARFERVVGSRDSEAFYMMNPDSSTGGNGGPELSIYLLRV